MTSPRRTTAALVGLLVLVLGGWLVRDLAHGGSTHPRVDRPKASAPVLPGTGQNGLPGASSGLPVRPLSALPAEAAGTWTLIQRGGPFPYPHNDGVVFDNRERRLPGENGGYYHEYTVPTPGSADRGARRMITGLRRELYYTGDHYQTFVVVDPGR